MQMYSECYDSSPRCFISNTVSIVMSYQESPRKRSRKSSHPISLKQRLQADTSEDDGTLRSDKVPGAMPASRPCFEACSPKSKLARTLDTGDRRPYPCLVGDNRCTDPAEGKHSTPFTNICTPRSKHDNASHMTTNPGTVDRCTSPSTQGEITGHCPEPGVPGTLPQGVRIKEEPLDTYEQPHTDPEQPHADPDNDLYPTTGYGWGEHCWDEVAAASAAADNYIQARMQKQSIAEPLLERRAYVPAPGDVLADVTTLDARGFTGNAFADRVMHSFASSSLLSASLQTNPGLLPDTTPTSIQRQGTCPARLLTKCQTRAHEVVSPQSPAASDSITPSSAQANTSATSSSSSSANRSHSDIIANPFVPVKGLSYPRNHPEQRLQFAGPSGNIVCIGYDRFSATARCGYENCNFSGEKRTTHFHCSRKECGIAIKQKIDIESHMNYHEKNDQLMYYGYKKFLKYSKCTFPNCLQSNKTNHIHCIRPGCGAQPTMAKLKSHMLAHVAKDKALASSSREVTRHADTSADAPAFARPPLLAQFADQFTSEQSGGRASGGGRAAGVRCGGGSPALIKAPPITFTAAISSRSSKAKMQIEAELASANVKHMKCVNLLKTAFIKYTFKCDIEHCHFSKNITHFHCSQENCSYSIKGETLEMSEAMNHYEANHSDYLKKMLQLPNEHNTKKSVADPPHNNFNNSPTASSFTSSETSAFVPTSSLSSLSPGNYPSATSSTTTPSQEDSKHPVPVVAVAAAENSGFLQKSANCGEPLCPFSNCDPHYHCSVQGCYTYTDNIGNTKNHSFLHNQINLPEGFSYFSMGVNCQSTNLVTKCSRQFSKCRGHFHCSHCSDCFIRTSTLKLHIAMHLGKPDHSLTAVRSRSSYKSTAAAAAADCPYPPVKQTSRHVESPPPPPPHRLCDDDDNECDDTEEEEEDDDVDLDANEVDADYQSCRETDNNDNKPSFDPDFKLTPDMKRKYPINHLKAENDDKQFDSVVRRKIIKNEEFSNWPTNNEALEIIDGTKKCYRPFCKLKKFEHVHCLKCNQAFSEPLRLNRHLLRLCGRG